MQKTEIKENYICVWPIKILIIKASRKLLQLYSNSTPMNPMNKQLQNLNEFIFKENREEVFFIIGLLTAKQNTFDDVLFMNAYQNANIVCI